MSSDSLERRYRLKTGGGNSPDHEHQMMNGQGSDQDVELYNYFASKTAHKGLKNSDTIQLAGAPEEDFQHQSSSEEDDEEPNPRNVSYAQLRRFEAKRIQEQTRCFDAWSRLANVQIQGMQQLLELMKVMMNSLVSSGKVGSLRIEVLRQGKRRHLAARAAC
ncbi:unnamed protein product [Cylicostephanus goldi]|uniref:Uncharacterized protein n=1 Tax=Cylicostephanus goldi TaxID=71465 RepID=A0A3P6RBG2_CYLGO|nr:unnamed protein product [Cylicostephanus goldi]